MRGVAKIAEHVIVPGEIPNVMRRAFNNLRNGRSGPAIVEIPTDIWGEEIGDLDYTPVSHVRYAPDPADVRKAAAAILAAKRPVIYAGTGVQWAEAWPQLRTFAELLGAPVTTSLGGKSSFPENHPLSLGSGGNAVPKTVHHFVTNADLIIGIGCSFTETNFGIKFPKGKKFIHATLDPNHLNKDVAGCDRPGRRRGADARCADRRAEADHQVEPRHRRSGARDHRGPRGVDGAVEAAARIQTRRRSARIA